MDQEYHLIFNMPPSPQMRGGAFSRLGTRRVHPLSRFAAGTLINSCIIKSFDRTFSKKLVHFASFHRVLIKVRPPGG